jgi:hypothetical protein
MEILDSITEQLAGNRRPLVSIALAAVPCPDTPVILTLHWHGFVKEKLIESEDAEGVTLTPVPSSSLQINEHWDDILDLEMAALEAGWELGAWDIVRSERRSCMRPGASAREALECLQAFGSSTLQYNGADLVLSEAPDADELIRVAARAGYVCWQFRPVHCGIWGEVSEDATLDAEGRRAPHCPVLPKRAHCDSARRTVYRLGEATNRRVML